jgi:hypothetical protein
MFGSAYSQYLHRNSDLIVRTAGAIILRISYGYKVEEGADPLVTLADRAMEQFSLSTAPGFLVNLVPARTSIMP